MAIGTLAAIGAVGAVAGGIAQGNAAKKAANAQTAAADRELELQTRIYDETSANFAPYRQGGQLGFDAYLAEMGLGDRPMVGGTIDDAGVRTGGREFGGFQQSPGYQFQLSRGMDALNSSGAARGNYLSGANIAGAMEFGQGLANQDYGNYLNRLQGIGQQGQAAAGNQAAAGVEYAKGAGSSIADYGNAQAAGAIRQGNAFSEMTNNLIGTAGYLNSQNNNGGGGGGNANFLSAPWGSKGFWG